MVKNDGKAYELLTERLTLLIASRTPGLVTTRLERQVTLIGRSGPSAIDVVWEFEAVDGPQRVLFECRDYGTSAVKRQAVHSWRSIVDDLSTPDHPTTGVMVTKTGFQSGAQQVANTYGVIIIQMREPSSDDLAGRLTQIDVVATVRRPYIDPTVPVSFAATEMLGTSTPPTEHVQSDRYSVQTGNGPAVDLTELLVAKVIRAFGEPAVPSQEVHVAFDPPATLHLDGSPIARITSVTGAAGEAVLASPTTTIGGRQSLAYLMKNVLDGTAVWFSENDELRVTNDSAERSHPLAANEIILGQNDPRAPKI